MNTPVTEGDPSYLEFPHARGISKVRFDRVGMGARPHLRNGHRDSDEKVILRGIDKVRKHTDLEGHAVDRTKTSMSECRR
jgi:hypothetical protein